MAPTDYPQIRGGFTDYHLWVTPFNRDEIFAAGMYPNQNSEAGGLPVWTTQDRNLVNQDIVVWYAE
jgi:primary-amine oxidase